MPLREEDIRRIGDYIKPWIREIVATVIPQRAAAGIDSKLLESMDRIEEELKARRELMEVRFDAEDRRFEALLARMDERFQSVDQRFEDLIGNMDRRFQSVDKRFNTLTWMIGVGFVVITTLTTVFALLA
jgi:hypothetical protein